MAPAKSTCWPLTDVVVDCREIAGVKDLEIRSLPCRVQSLVRLAPDVMQLKLKLPTSERLLYLAGQYVDLMLRDGTRRSFSMASPPHDNEHLELHLHNYGGAFSAQVFGRMKERDILRLEGPFGTFYLREASARRVLLLASGTGFAPVKAIIEQALASGISRPLTLYWGCRVRADLYMNDLAERWQTEHGVRYVPVLSEPRPADEWTGRTGLVHRAVMEDLPDLSEYQVYACGAPVMVEAARTDFTASCGLPPDEFFCDAFTPSAPAGSRARTAPCRAHAALPSSPSPPHWRRS